MGTGCWNQVVMPAWRGLYWVTHLLILGSPRLFVALSQNCPLMWNSCLLSCCHHGNSTAQLILWVHPVGELWLTVLPWRFLKPAFLSRCNHDWMNELQELEENHLLHAKECLPWFCCMDSVHTIPLLLWYSWLIVPPGKNEPQRKGRAHKRPHVSYVWHL